MESTGTGSSTSSHRSHEKLSRDSHRFGGVKIGSAFFGWVTAMGISVLGTALLTAFGAGVGLATGTDLESAADSVAQNPDAVGWVSGIALVVVLLVAYYCGGYVAGRMARFNGVRQGVAVWVWAIVAALVVAGLTAFAGAKFDALGNLNGVPQFSVEGGQVTAVGLVALAIAVIIPLVGAILGGLAGMRYHRRIDRGAEALGRESDRPT